MRLFTGAPSFAVTTKGRVGEILQPYFRQYPVRDVVFGADVDVDATEVVAVREAYFRNPAGGTAFEARAAYEGWQDARDVEVCAGGHRGLPEGDVHVRSPGRHRHRQLPARLQFLEEHRANEERRLLRHAV